MIKVVFQTAFKDFFRPQRIITWGAVVVGIFLIGLFWKRFASHQMSPLESYGQLAQIFCYRIVALAAAILSMSVVAQEIEQKTIVFLLTRSIPRPILLVGRTLAALLFVVLIGCGAIMAGSLATMGYRAIGSPEVMQDFLVVTLGATAYVPLFVLVSLLINRAMIVSLLFAFGWETFAQNLSGMRPLSLLTYMNGAAGHKELRAQGMMTFMAGDMTLSRMPLGLSIAALIGVGVLAAMAGVVLFSKFEYSPREDAE